MREILFRGKGEDNGLWLFGDLRQWSEKKKGIYDNDICRTLQVLPVTVGQFTGLTDKNGKRIFEGDIVVAELSNGNYRGFSWGKQKVVFSQGAFCLENNRAEQTPIRSYAPTVAFEVVGNIHDNLEDT